MIPNSFQILHLLPQELKTLSIRAEQWNFPHSYERHNTFELLSSCTSLTSLAQDTGVPQRLKSSHSDFEMLSVTQQ